MKGARRPSTRAVRVGVLVVALVLAGLVSYYAASSPDGLNRVAEDKGFSSTQKDHATSDNPLAGYRTKGIGNDRLSGGLAGVVGVLVVLTLAGGLVLAVRRRRSPDDESAGLDVPHRLGRDDSQVRREVDGPEDVPAAPERV